MASILATYQRKLGHHADVVMRREFTGGVDEQYDFAATTIPLSRPVTAYRWFQQLPRWMQHPIRWIYRKYKTLRFYLRVRRLARGYDVLHIHSVWPAIFFTWGTPKILELHGDDVRHAPSFRGRVSRWLTDCFLQVYSRWHPIYVSTPDLVNDVPNSHLIDNPVDTERFTLREGRDSGTALYTLKWHDTDEYTGTWTQAYDLAKRWGLNLSVLNIRAGDWIPHEKMPAYLGQFGYFIDRFGIKSLSKTALEALSVGCRVWDYQGHLHIGLPPQHRPEYVAQYTLQLYAEVLQ